MALSRDDLLAARAFARWKIGRPNEAEALAHDAATLADYEAMVEAATRAGRLGEFEHTWRYARKRVQGERLEGYVGRADVLAHLLPYAMSDEAYVKRRFRGLDEREVHEVVRAARQEGARSRQRALDAYLDEARRGIALVEDGVKRRRLRVDASADPRKVDPLQKDGQGRWARLGGRRSGSNPLSRMGRGVSRFWSQVGGNVPERKLETHEDASLRLLREKYGVEVITPERAARMKQRRRGALSRTAQAATLAPFRLARRSLVGGLRLGIGGGVASWRTRRLRRRLAQAEGPHGRAQLLRMIAEQERDNPWRKLGIRSLRDLPPYLPKTRLVLAALLLLFGLGTLGWTGSLVLGLQAVLAFLAGGVNLFLAALNALLALIVGTVLVAGNFAIGLFNGATGLVYDSVWTTIGQFVPDAQYGKPALTTGTVALPQVSYVASLFHVATDAQGGRTYDWPSLVGVDADGMPTGSFFWSSTGFSLPQFGYEVLSCEDLDDISRCRSFYDQLREGGGGFLRELACRVAPDASFCTTQEGDA